MVLPGRTYISKLFYRTPLNRWGSKNWFLYLILFSWCHVSCYCYLPLLHGANVWSAVYDCGIFKSYSHCLRISSLITHKSLFGVYIISARSLMCLTEYISKFLII